MAKWKITYNDGIKQTQETAKNDESIKAIINKIKINRWNLEKCTKIGGKKNV